MKFKYLLLAIPLFLFITCNEDDTPEAIDCATQTITLSVDEVQATLCGTAQGSFRVFPIGRRVEDFTFSIDGVNFQSSNTFTDLAAGNYTITAQSTNGCIANAETTITDENNVTLSIAINDAGCSSNNGEIRVSASQAGYEFSIDSLNFQASGNFTGLSSGTYSVTARNSQGCGITEEVVLTSGISYKNTIANIITTNCSTESNCHGADSPNITKLATLENIQELAVRVRARVVAETMPPGNRDITQEEIALIDCWVRDGALDN